MKGSARLERSIGIRVRLVVRIKLGLPGASCSLNWTNITARPVNSIFVSGKQRQTSVHSLSRLACVLPSSVKRFLLRHTSYRIPSLPKKRVCLLGTVLSVHYVLILPPDTS